MALGASGSLFEAELEEEATVSEFAGVDCSDVAVRADSNNTDVNSQRM